MRIMGLDLGKKTIGVAVSDEMGFSAQPITVIRRKGLKQDLTELAALIEQYDVTSIVLGLPRNMNGSIGPQAEKSKVFGAMLEEKFQLKIDYWDERLTTVSAERVLLEGDVSRAKRKKVIDKVAASLILQGYLDRLAGQGAGQ